MSNQEKYTVGYPKRLTRAESFLGIHFDFHARDTDTPVGSNTTRAAIQRIIDEVGPDYIECDCKGHHGFSSYPTKVGNPAPVIIGDPLRIWREVTAEHGVALYMHYSGLYDSKAIKDHPEWAAIDNKGEKNPNFISTFSAYTDELMLPQLKELIDVYEVDGVWVDGDCCGMVRDYSEASLQAFHERTGIQSIPREPEDPFYEEFTQFSRDNFISYLRYYSKQLHNYSSKFQVGSAWAFTSFLPEAVSAEVDFLSGDSSAINQTFARMESRFLVRQDVPWDIMTWSFAGNFSLDGNPGPSVKSVVQLQQEAATIISLGGAYQSVSNQKLDGTVIEWQLQVMKEVAVFCREREYLCHRGKLIPQIAILHSTTDYYRKPNKLFNSIGALYPLKGVMDSLLESQDVVEILMEHQIRGRAKEYPLVIIPEWEQLAPGLREELLEYVEQGGNLLVIGPKAIKMFEAEMEITLEGEVDEKAVHWIEYGGWLAGQCAAHQSVTLGERVEAFGKLYKENDNTGPYETAASVTPYGKGQLAAMYYNFGDYYYNAATSVARHFLHGLVRKLFPKPMVEVSGSGFVDVVLAENHGKTIVHLINTAGQQKNMKIYVFDEIPPVGPLQVTLRLDHEPKQVTLEPGGMILPYTYSAGEIQVTVPLLDIHRMVVVE